MNEQKPSFLEEVMAQIKSKEAKRFILAELNHHLKEAKKEWLGKGFSETEAEEKAVKQMGSPQKIGQELNKLHRPRVDWMLIGLLIMTLLFGFLPLLGREFIIGGLSQFNKIFYNLIGVGTALGLMLFDYRKFKNYGWLFYVIGFFILITLTFFPSMTINGKPYIRFLGFSIGSLMAIPFFYMAWVSFFQNRNFKIWQFIGLLLTSLVWFLALNNLATTFIYIMMVFVMLWWSPFGRKRSTIITSSCLAFSMFVLGVILWITAQAYQKVRILAFLHPEDYEKEAGYQYLYLKKQLAQAGWFGHTNNNELLNAQTDFAFVSITTHFGWIVGIILIIILGLLTVRMLVIARTIQDTYGKLLVIGAITLFTVQYLYNIGMILGFLPLTSMSLPFISYGLMPVLLNAICIGMVLSVFRRKKLIPSTSYH